MPSAVWLIAGVLVGYIIGAVPVGFVVCRLYGVDIRTVGSGRTGTTNAWRAAGLKAALPTLVGDSLKGAVAIWALQGLLSLVAAPPGEDIRILILALAGGMAVIGHNWSVFLGFRGGAGGITCAVACMALHPLAGLVVWIAGAALLYWSRIAAIATFSASVVSLAAFLSLAIMDELPWTYLAFPILAVAGVAISLRPNRTRLQQGAERVITLW